MQQTDDTPPKFCDIYRKNGIGLLALARLSSVPIDATYALISGNVRMPNEIVQKVLDTVNDLTGEQYTLENVDIPLDESISELQREINAFLSVKGDNKSE